MGTSYTHLTKRFFQQSGTQVHLVPMSSYVEIMISLRFAEAIGDLVQAESNMVADYVHILTHNSKSGTDTPAEHHAQPSCCY